MSKSNKKGSMTSITNKMTVVDHKETTEIERRETFSRKMPTGFGSLIKRFQNGEKKGYKRKDFSLKIPISDAHNIVFPLQRSTGKYSMSHFRESKLQRVTTARRVKKVLEKLNRVNKRVFGTFEKKIRMAYIIIGLCVFGLIAIGVIAFAAAQSTIVLIVCLALAVLVGLGSFLVKKNFNQKIEKHFSKTKRGHKNVIADENLKFEMERKELKWILGTNSYWITLRLDFMYKVVNPRPAAGFSKIRPDGQFPPELPKDGRVFNSMAPMRGGKARGGQRGAFQNAPPVRRNTTGQRGGYGRRKL